MNRPEEPISTVEGGSSSLGNLPAHDPTGKVLGDFRVERILGKGGMGEVYLSRQISLDRPVALKVLKAEYASNPTYMARFEAEAWAAAKLNHPNIVHIYTLGSLEGLRFIAMEYVQGTNLREYLVKKGIPEMPLALAIMRQAAQAVGAAGEVGLIHRDIKPENLLLTRKGQVKVADFGLARLPEGDRLHLTAPGMTLGTPLYMSPEQVQNHEMDHRSDLYSLGVTFYHMLAGHPPFRAETAVALALKHLRDRPASLAVHRPDLPPELVALVMKLMEKVPADRYQSAGEMLRDLARVKESVLAATAVMPIAEVPHSPLKGVPPAAAPAPPSRAPRAPGETPAWAPGRKAFAAIAAASLVVGAGLGWMARSPDLLAESAVAPEAAALWMAGWRSVPPRPTAALQYRYAQSRAPASQRAAAWLAVPGRFPNDSDWAWSAYLQLTRGYLREGDARRLDALARELKAAEDRSGAGREKWRGLERVIRAGERALDGDTGEARALLANNANVAAMDPALAALALEVVDRAARGNPGADGRALLALRDQLLGPLKIAPRLYDRIRAASP